MNRRILTTLALILGLAAGGIQEARAQYEIEASQAQTDAGTAGAPYYVSPRRLANYPGLSGAADALTIDDSGFGAWLPSDGNADTVGEAMAYFNANLFVLGADDTQVTDQATRTTDGRLRGVPTAVNRTVAALTTDITLTTSSDRFQYLTPDTPGLDVNLPASGDFFVLVNRSTSISFFISISGTPLATVAPSASMTVIWDETSWVPLGRNLSRSITKAASYVIGTDSTEEAYDYTVYVTSAATITLPAVAVGMKVAVITIGAIAVSVDSNASDLIYLDGTALDDGDKITNTSTAGDIAVLEYFSSVGWYASTNSWTDGGP